MIPTFTSDLLYNKMKFILILIGFYIVYRYFVKKPTPLTPPQEPDIYIDHEEVKREHEKN